MVGWVRFGSLRRLQPISAQWGFERGLPIDRYYIEAFLAAHAGDIRGHGLEVKEDLYSSRFGGDYVTRVDILHPELGNPKATIVADLTKGDGLPSDAFDFIVLTQTLHLIYDVESAVRTLYRILKPGGVLLTTVSGISKISRGDMDRWGHHWAFTSRSAERLFGDFFGRENVTVEAHGNVLAAVAFLHGVASQELRSRHLNYHDPDFEVLVTIRAVKRSGNGSGIASGQLMPALGPSRPTGAC
jgi:SAM-dependent methyltransferase